MTSAAWTVYVHPGKNTPGFQQGGGTAYTRIFHGLIRRNQGFRYESLGQKSSNHRPVASYTVAHTVMTMIHMIEAFHVETPRSAMETYEYTLG